jgi:hypothetical protein
MRARTVFAIGAVAATALSLHIWRAEMIGGLDGLRPAPEQFSEIAPDPDDDLTLTLRREARTAMTDLEARQAHF